MGECVPDKKYETFEAGCFLLECIRYMVQNGATKKIVSGPEIPYKILFAPFGYVKSEKIIKMVMETAGSLDEVLHFEDPDYGKVYEFRLSNPELDRIEIDILDVYDVLP